MRSIERECIASKLRLGGMVKDAEKLLSCHTEEKVITCRDCAKRRVIWNHCDRFYCPDCQPKLARKRNEELEFWTQHSKALKHIVLTQKSGHQGLKELLTHFKKALKGLMRSVFWRRCTQGGVWAIEVTRKRKYWHVHCHLLVQANFVSQFMLREIWAKKLGQEDSITRVYPVGSTSYSKEVKKYVVKGSEMASKWTACDVVEFVQAMKGQRNYGTWGKLYKISTQWRAMMAQIREESLKCECGCSRFRIETLEQEEARFLENNIARPPPVERVCPIPSPQLSLGLN